MNQKYKKFYNFIKKNDGKLSPEQLQKVTFEREFLSNLLKKFIRVLGTISAKGKTFGPHHKKTCLQGCREGRKQTWLYDHRRWLDA